MHLLTTNRSSLSEVTVEAVLSELGDVGLLTGLMACLLAGLVMD